MKGLLALDTEFRLASGRSELCFGEMLPIFTSLIGDKLPAGDKFPSARRKALLKFLITSEDLTDVDYLPDFFRPS